MRRINVLLKKKKRLPFGEQRTLAGHSQSLASLVIQKEGTFLSLSDAAFWQTAMEAADSRFYGGIHTRLDNELGLQEGKRIAQRFDKLNWKK